jgi:hypothetical protein
MRANATVKAPSRCGPGFHDDGANAVFFLVITGGSVVIAVTAVIAAAVAGGAVWTLIKDGPGGLHTVMRGREQAPR